MRFSIVMINYNGEKTVKRAVQSMLDQDYPDVEIICVDDASTDSGIDYLKECSEKHSNVRLVRHEVNKGRNSGRISGMKAATGDYILFLDSDDELCPNLCSTLAKVLEKKQYDIVGFGTEIVFEGVFSDESKRANEELLMLPEGEILGDDIIDSYFNTGSINFTVWNKCYSRELIAKVLGVIKDEVLNLSEDYYLSFIVSHYATSYFGISDKLIKYSFGNGISTAKKMTFEKILSNAVFLKAAYDSCRLFVDETGLGKNEIAHADSGERDCIGGLFIKMRYLSAEEKEKAFAFIRKTFGDNKVIASLATAFWDDVEYVMSLVDFEKAFPRKEGDLRTIGLYYHRLYNGGTEKLITQMAEYLVGAGYKVVVITDAPVNELDYPLPTGAVRVSLNEKYPVENGKGYYARCEKIVACIKEHGIDAVVNNAYASDYAPWDLLAVKSTGAAFIPYCHSVFMAGQIDGWPGIIRKTAPYRFADGIITLSDVDRLFWSTVNPRVHQVINPVRHISKPGGNKERAHNVIWIGRLDDDNKNPYDALHIFQRVLQLVPDAKLFMCGHAPEERLKDMKEVSVLFGIDKNVEFVGYTTEPEKYYEKSEIMLMTSNYEGFPLVVTESFSYGIPVVMYDLPYLTLTKNSEAVVGVSYKDIDTAAEMIVRIMTDEKLKDTMSLKAVEEAQTFKNVDIGKMWTAVFDSIAANEKTVSDTEISHAMMEFVSTVKLAFKETSFKIDVQEKKIKQCYDIMENSYKEYCETLKQVEALQKEVDNFKYGGTGGFLVRKIRGFIWLVKNKGFKYAVSRIFK